MKSYENLTPKPGGRNSIVVNGKFILMMILIIAIFSSCKQNTQPDEPNKESPYEITVQLDSLLETESIFKLKTLFMRKSELLSKVDSIYYGAWIDYISNKPEDALEKANTYMIEVQPLAGNADEKIIQTHILKLNIYRDNYAYQKGLNEVNYILNYGEEYLNTSEIADYKDIKKILLAVKNIPPQKKICTSDVELNMNINKYGMWNLPILIGETWVDMLFDTGCHISVISSSYAKECKLKILDTSTEIESSTKAAIGSKLAYADSITFGHIKIYNTLFYVLEDNNLGFPEYDFFIDGILGLNVLKQLDEIQISNSGLLRIPKHPTEKHLDNFVVYRNIPLIMAQHKKDTIRLKLDTGGTFSHFFRTYYTQFNDEFKPDAGIKKVEYGGLGGANTFSQVILDSVSFSIGNTCFRKDDLGVHTEKTTRREPRNYHGLFGLDMIEQYNEMTISFKYNSIHFN